MRKEIETKTDFCIELQPVPYSPGFDVKTISSYDAPEDLKVKMVGNSFCRTVGSHQRGIRVR